MHLWWPHGGRFFSLPIESHFLFVILSPFLEKLENGYLVSIPADNLLIPHPLQRSFNSTSD